MNENRMDKLKAVLSEPEVPESLSPENVKLMLDSKGKKSAERKPVHNALRWTAGIAASAVLIGTGTYAARQLEEASTGSRIEVAGCYTMSADNYRDVYDYMKEFTKEAKKEYYYGIFDDFGYNAGLGEAVMEEAVEGEADGEFAVEESTEAAAVTQTTGADASAEISEVYNQEAGVLESDIVRTDGRYIYSVQSMDSRFYMNVAETDGTVFTDSYRVRLLDYLPETVESGNVQAMYLKEGRLAVILDAYERTGIGEPIFWRTHVLIFAQNDGLELLGSYSQDGGYSDVRMMEDGTLYLISCHNWYDEYEDENYEECIPAYYCGTEECVAEPSDILLAGTGADGMEIDYDLESAFTNIGSLNILSDTPWESIDFKSLAGFSGEMYCSLSSIYLASHGYSSYDVPEELKDRRVNSTTDFTRIGIDGGIITPLASASVAGVINDQFSMSEYNGVFRAAVTRRGYAFVNENGANAVVDDNAVYTFDLDLNRLGCVDGFGLNEDIKSASFQGDLAYVVTFRQTDPLYAIDLSDPYAPVVLDEYKINGYSSYMQQWSEGQLLGFGVDGDEWGTLNGLKLVMFDNSVPENLAELDVACIYPEDVATDIDLKSDWGWISSAAQAERKALLIAPEKNLIAVPFTCTMEYKQTYMNDTDFGYALYSYTDNTFELRGIFYGQDQLNRAMYIGNTLFLVGADEMIAVDLETMIENDRVVF